MASTLTARHAHRETVKKSVFLGQAAPVSDAAGALSFIAAYRDPGATHNCWAYRLGAAYRFSDDGEPGGTAGRPILQAIDSQDCDRVVVLVTRWYGGVKLGTGGLVRAYGDCAASCLKVAPRIQIVDTLNAVCSCRFVDLQRLKAGLLRAGAMLVSESFDAAGATLIVAVPREEIAGLSRWVADATRGRSQLRPQEHRPAG